MKTAANVKLIAGLLGAGIVLASLVGLGQRYIGQCMKAGKDIDACWDKGLSIAGMGMGGQLSAGAVIGYVLGMLGKEKEKREQYEAGYWTLNPELHREE